jgi:hypothetical protein
MAVPEKTGRKERRRAERRAQKEQRKKQKQRRLPNIGKPLAYAASVLLVAAAGYWGYAEWSSGAPGEHFPSMGNRHIAPSAIGLTTYNSDPPTSGPHLPSLASWGIHENPIPKELQVHNLEDGGVVVQYNCPPAEESCRKLVGNLAEIVKRYNHAILAPYPGMSHKIALTAWTRIDKFDDFDEKRIVRFIESYINIDHHARK